jgi:hypothetical protein
VPGLTVVCVFNDRAVREECLDRSLAAHLGTGDVEYIPVDNTSHAFASAGAALNQAAALARHEVVVFVHQDVYLHSVERIARAAAHLRDGAWGLLGANGVTREGESVGRLRDRLAIIGETSATPVAVDSVDEVLFLVSRDQVIAHPLSEDPDLAWHAYAVEYGLRMRELGFDVGAVDMACTHNSLTMNVERLDVAHQRVAQLFPNQVPVRTTCGTAGATTSGWRDTSLVRDHGWRLRWLKNSVRAARARRRLRLPAVLSDIRHDIDMLSLSENTELNVINLDDSGRFAAVAGGPLTLSRSGRRFVFWCVSTVEELVERVASLPTTASTLVVDLNPDVLTRLNGRLPAQDEWLLGVHDSSTWLLGGPVADALPERWTATRSTPLGSPLAAARQRVRT